MEIIYKVLVQEFGYKPALTKEQFLALGFAERKIILVKDIVGLCRQKHLQLSKKKIRAGNTKRGHIVSRKGYLQSTIYSAVKSCETKTSVTNLGRKSEVRSVASENSKHNSNFDLSVVEVVKGKHFTESQSTIKPLPEDHKTDLRHFDTDTDTTLKILPQKPVSVPEPCPTLAITPLKSVNDTAYATDSLTQTPQAVSKAEVVEVDNSDLAKNFQVIKAS